MKKIGDDRLSMVGKRKMKPVLEDGEVALEEREHEQEERRPPVTQVVEVVEDSAPESVQEASSPAPEIHMHDTTHTHEEPQEETAEESEQETETDEKRKVMVDELFQKHDRMSEDIGPEISMHKRNSARSIMTWAIVCIVACLVVGAGLFVFSNKEKVSGLFATPSPTPTSTPTPSPTPEVTAKREDITIEVLNGSGKAGAAGKMKSLLEDKGYTVSGTKNADNYDYKETEIMVKPGKEAYAALIQEDLKEDYAVSSTPGTLSEDSDADAQVIVGAE